MRKIMIIPVIILSIVLFSVFAKAEPAKTIVLDNNTLLLNGSGYRSKFFIKVYRGSLYLTDKILSDTQSIKDEEVIFKSGYPGAIKMEFVYSEVEAEKIKGAFREGIEKNSPELLNADYVNNFISTFNFNVVEGDIITLFIKNENTVTVFYNGKTLNTINGGSIGRAVYKIYLGKEPADGSLRSDMLGG
ncbi:MAG: hypothetical protein FXF49_02085 [Flexistipes sinusarabici]|uniref:Chalcone isomerase domain-containing protein n=1 Tax=Flexistipes sinusarabici TaxID=2352 RepID=A0A5D0MS06_FLESI|nr:chalcone isomerase family protein [Flexistipes sinusarabici]TYB34730.1 MAG: hypothetical protein FXF49_02085 [Flexistipes sinusarabici]